VAEREHADVAIIGAGIAGAGVAAMLRGRARTILLEAEDRPGHHATGRSAAMYLRNYGNAPIRALTRASAADFEAPPAEWGCGELLSPRGLLYVADAGGRPALDAALAVGEDLAELTPAEAAAMVPILRAELLSGAAFERDGRDIDVDALHQAWLRLFRREGGEIAGRAPVSRIERADGAWRIDAGARRIEAAVVVNAAGAWADEVARMAGARPAGITPMRRSMAVLPAPEIPGFDRWPLIADIGEGWYAKPQSGALLVSPAEEDPVAPHDAFADDMTLAEGLDRFARATTHEVTRVTRTWAGLRSFAPDRTPVVGFDPAAEGFFWLAGQGGYGIQTAPAMSRLAAALILRAPGEQPVDAATVAALSPARFHAS
jgi:D-arginine dehydrogenase